MADIAFTGNLGGPPELRFTPNGKAVADFSVAESHRRKVGNEWQDEGTTWWRVTAWDWLAETVAETLHKGSRVMVTGQVRSREWEDREGQKRVAYDVTARQVGIVPKRDQQAPQQPQQADAWGAPASDEPPF